MKTEWLIYQVTNLLEIPYIYLQNYVKYIRIL